MNRNFEYDAIYRLIYADGRESNTQNNSFLYTDAPAPGSPNANNTQSYSRSYDYDKLGNINSVVQSGVNGFTRDYTYNTGVNTLQKIEDATPSTMESYTYDSCGNTLTTNLNRFYYWNHADQLICYKNGSGTPSVFTQYDYSGQDRVSKLVRTGSDYERTIYIDGIFEYVKLESGTSIYEKNYIHVMDDKSRIAEVRINPGSAFPTDITDPVTYHIEDQIGSSILRLTTTATVIDREEYYPFGDASLRTFTYKRYRYVGKEKDAESGLYYYGARYYASWTCRFISVDPLAHDYPYLTPYNYCGNKSINRVDIEGLQPGPSKSFGPISMKPENTPLVQPKSAGPFKTGPVTPPSFSYDNGFLDTIPALNYTPQVRSPRVSDYASYTWWGAKLIGAQIFRWDLVDATRAYDHFRTGGGKTYFFDLKSYLKTDQSGVVMLENAKKIAMKSAMQLLDKAGEVKMSSEGFSAGGSIDVRFPYPETENWQKAVGAFNFWMVAKVTATESNGNLNYSMNLTIFAEDKYNFNPGAADIATGTPDASNGAFEVTDLAKQFMQYGTYSEDINWSVKSKTTNPQNTRATSNQNNTNIKTPAVSTSSGAQF